MPIRDVLAHLDGLVGQMVRLLHQAAQNRSATRCISCSNYP